MSKCLAKRFVQFPCIHSSGLILATEQTACPSAGINNPLTSGPPHYIKGSKRSVDLSCRRYVANKMTKDKGVLDSHSGTGALPGGCCVGCVPDNANSIVCISRRGFMFPNSISLWVFLI